MRKKVFTLCAMFTALALLSAALFVLHSAGYRVNRSASLPGHVYRLTPISLDTQLVRGDCIAIDLAGLRNPVIGQGVERGYVNLREPMLKRIGALPGDRVVLEINLLLINDKAMQINVASTDSCGGQLSAWPTPLVLPENSYWLVSSPERGFDSRYFGPIDRKFFTHRAVIIF